MQRKQSVYTDVSSVLRVMLNNGIWMFTTAHTTVDHRAVHTLVPNVDSVSHNCLIFVDMNEKWHVMKTD